jgi:hypothetical protein
MVKRLALKALEYTAACLTVSLMFVTAETLMMIAAGEFR